MPLSGIRKLLFVLECNLLGSVWILAFESCRFCVWSYLLAPWVDFVLPVGLRSFVWLARLEKSCILTIIKLVHFSNLHILAISYVRGGRFRAYRPFTSAVPVFQGEGVL